MNAAELIDYAIEPAIELLPQKMRRELAVRFLVAVACQESNLEHRHQVGGPAHGWWQFEQRGGLWDVTTRGSVAADFHFVAERLGYNPHDVDGLFAALEHNDILAAAAARCLLWLVPAALPRTEAEAWGQYLQAWRPGRPAPERWRLSWELAEAAITYDVYL